MRFFDRGRRRFAGEQVAGQQAAAARPIRRPRLAAVGDGDEDAVGVEAEPGAAGHGVEAGDGRYGAVEKARRLAAAGVELLAVGADDQRGVVQSREKRGR